MLAALVIVLALTACSDRKRPYGYIRIGPARDHLAAQEFLNSDRLILSRDAGGWKAMSTLSTDDLSPLRILDEPSGPVLVSDFTESKYDLDGNVMHGPATVPLPFYRLELDPSVYESTARDTLFVAIGEEVPRGWRLKVPAVLAPQPEEPE